LNEESNSTIVSPGEEILRGTTMGSGGDPIDGDESPSSSSSSSSSSEDGKEETKNPKGKNQKTLKKKTKADKKSINNEDGEISSVTTK
jgi:hypothetical protein